MDRKSKKKAKAPKEPRPKSPLLNLLFELEDNKGLWAGAEESLLTLGHKRRTVNFAVERGYIEPWRMCEDTTYYQLTVKGKRRIAFDHWGAIERREFVQFRKALVGI